MPRVIKAAAAQVGAVHITARKADTVQRLINLLREAAEQKVQLVVFPECTLTTFFPRHFFASQDELDKYFEHGEDITQSADVKPLFDEAKKHAVDFVLGYAERTSDGIGYNTSVYFSAGEGKVINKYRKVHLPGTVEPFEDPKATNQLEKRYFKPGNLGFQAFRAPGLVADSLKQSGHVKDGEELVGKGDPIVGMLICNDRRWPEAWRCYTLQGAELIVFGFNTGGNMAHLWGSKPMSPEEAQKEALFHSRLVQQGNSYMNACFSVSSARCGLDDGKYDLIAGSAICNPEGHIIAEAKTTGDELVIAELDLAECRQGKEKTFDYDRHRRIETYGLISSQTGVVEPPLL
ncbi:carbon-nitrogen hydrolase [Polychaeton citri CBS 116435]|uniref:Carbon-nitrogen hydrolase n=1 Tax=Polychaeton citri CBS 116435 TaxID=1314669 RepID=A0A9P4Q802_9PEZI|nr:carbon-nitrogen hydrolase [Polychaeton citri CBS 116435]